jgi:hypothetical protein
MMACTSLSLAEEREINQQRGKQIIWAIQQHEQQYETIPESLDNLVPMYFDILPTTTTGQEFIYHYRVDWQGNVDYSLCFYYAHQSRICCHYRDDFWDCSLNSKGHS